MAEYCMTTRFRWKRKKIERLDWQEQHYSVENVKEGASPNGQYEKALQKINDKVLFVGLQERLDESVVRIQEILGWKKPLYYQKVNVNETRLRGKEKPESVVKIIRERNRIDSKLHDKITEEFDSRMP